MENDYEEYSIDEEGYYFNEDGYLYDIDGNPVKASTYTGQLYRNWNLDPPYDPTNGTMSSRGDIYIEIPSTTKIR